MAKGPPTSMQTPARVFDVELSEPLPLIDSPVRPDGSRYGGALVLIRLHGQPLGTLELDLSGGAADPALVARLVWQKLQAPITDHLLRDGLPPVCELGEAGLACDDVPSCRRFDDAASPFVSVVISTHERPGPLAACIASILRAEYPRFEVLVVDDAPRTATTRGVVSQRFGDCPRGVFRLEPRHG